jgi:hypothetical protein
MPRRLRPMTVADLALLPDPCARCTFWEVGLLDLAAPEPDRGETGVGRGGDPALGLLRGDRDRR